VRFSLTNDERNQLIVRHLDSVHAAANTFKVQPWIRDELISAGYEALVLASTRFDPSSNATFSTFAYRPVLGAMYDLLDNYKLWSTRHRYDDDPPGQTRLQNSGDGSFSPHCPDYEHASLTSQVLAAVDRLPPAAAELIKAHFLQEQTLSFAGARLGI